MKYLLPFLLILPGCTTTVRIDDSYVEGCVVGAQVIISQVPEMELVPHAIEAICMDLYIERLKRFNPKVKFNRTKEHAFALDE